MKLQYFFAGLLAAGLPCLANAQLAPGLTAFGAQQAGSADGAIPAYTGGISAMTNLPAASSTTGYPDPFASEKPLFSITSANMSQYASMLTPGSQALLKRYPDYRLDVYPTHRTTSYPKWVLANDLKNATSAQLAPDGDGVTGAYGGVPFPVPKNGMQVMWNAALSYRPAQCHVTFESYLVDSSGSVTDLGILKSAMVTPYYNSNATSLPNMVYRLFTEDFETPAAEAGQLFLFKYPIDYGTADDVDYFYSPGTRRVRLAPEFKYDTPIASYGGAIDYDEIELFSGQHNKFNYNLVGEKEMIVPYNDYKFANTTETALLGQHFINPDGVRWERHRVWIVDATLKPGERHAYSRWTFYVDEDSWRIIASESYDQAGNFYRVGFDYPWQNYSDGEATTFAITYGFYDLSKGTYEVSYAQTADSGFFTCSTTFPNMANFSPQAMAAQSVR